MLSLQRSLWIRRVSSSYSKRIYKPTFYRSFTSSRFFREDIKRRHDGVQQDTLKYSHHDSKIHNPKNEWSSPIEVDQATHHHNIHSSDELYKNMMFYIYNGNVHFDRGEYANAVEQYLISERIHPDSPEPWIHLSSTYDQMQQLDKASVYSLKVISYSKSHNMDPFQVSKEYRILSDYYKQQGKLLESHQMIREAHSIYPSDTYMKMKEHLEDLIGMVKTNRRLSSNVSLSSLENLVKGYPFEIRDTNKGFGIFATRDFEQGELIFEEKPIVSMDCISNQVNDFCHCCKKPLLEPDFGFISADLSQKADEMGDAYDFFKGQVLAELDIKPLNIVHDSSGKAYCSPNCMETAQSEYNSYIYSSKISQSDKEILFAPRNTTTANSIPSNASRFLMDQITCEMMVYLLAKVSLNHNLLKEIYNLSYVEYLPRPLLLDHEKEKIQAFRRLFPHFKDTLLTESNFLALKSIVEQNAFSFETHALRIEFDILEPEGEVPEDADPEDSSMLGLNILIRDDNVFKGHGLFGLSSFLNHSCDPNVGFSLPALTHLTTWTALRPIRKGEELEDSYIALDHFNTDRTTRRNAIKHGFNFDCKCHVCESGK